MLGPDEHAKTSMSKATRSNPGSTTSVAHDTVLAPNPSQIGGHH